MRLFVSGVIELTVTDTHIHAPWKRLSGQVFGFTSPNPAEFKTRQLTETTAGASAPNMLTVSLVANFRLNAVRNPTP